MAARILFHGDIMMRALLEAYWERDPEMRREMYQRMVERFGAEPRAGASTDSRDCLRLVRSMTREQWRHTQQRLAEEWRRQLEERRKNAAPPTPEPTGRCSWGRRYKAELEARQREAEREKREGSK